MLDAITLEPFNAETAWKGYAHPVTPVEAFFKRNHAPILHLDAASYSLGIADRCLSLQDLRALPQVSLEVTLECAGNGRTSFAPQPPGTPWGIKAVSNALWGGVRLQEVLQRFPPPPSTVEVVFWSSDRAPKDQGLYSRSLTLAEISETDPLLALTMNGEPLPAEHGFPVRIIVPGYYGMAAVKWLERIEYWETPFQGYFQVEDYHVKTDGQRRRCRWMLPKSLIHWPQHGQTTTRQLQARGWAWSGRFPIDRVELEIETAVGLQRLEAELGPLRGPRAWRGWSADLLLEPGLVTVRSFAVDTQGTRQPIEAFWNEDGYENNGAQTVTWTVAD